MAEGRCVELTDKEENLKTFLSWTKNVEQVCLALICWILLQPFEDLGQKLCNIFSSIMLDHAGSLCCLVFVVIYFVNVTFEINFQLIATNLKPLQDQQLLILTVHESLTKHQADIQMLYDLYFQQCFHHLLSQDLTTSA